ncbi:hypothetical protein [Brucella vulpis]|uniref:hypothetical protein n=1 Tax=Brucella vulpis TaxID=981386 RepID=UPI00403304BC
MKNPSIFGSSQKRGVLIPICSRFESVTFRESEAILTLPEVCQQSRAKLWLRPFPLPVAIMLSAVQAAEYDASAATVSAAAADHQTLCLPEKAAAPDRA